MLFAYSSISCIAKHIHSHDQLFRLPSSRSPVLQHEILKTWDCRYELTLLYIQIVKFKLSSELKDDPVTEVMFYEKETECRSGPIPLRQLSLDKVN